MLSHWNITTLKFTGAQFAFLSLDTAFKFLLPEFSVHTVRLKCTKDTAPPAEFHTKFCTQEINPGALNPAQSQVRWTPCHAFTAAAWSGVQISPRHFWQAPAPGCTFVTALVGSALPQLGELCGSAHSADMGCESTKHLQGSSSNFSSHLCHWEQSSTITHWGVPELQAKSLPRQISLKSSKRNKHRLNPVLQNLAWVQAAYCSLQLCGKTVTWYLHLRALCL